MKVAGGKSLAARKWSRTSASASVAQWRERPGVHSRGELDRTGNELIGPGIYVAQTLTFNVMATQDLVFPGPYLGTPRP